MHFMNPQRGAHLQQIQTMSPTPSGAPGEGDTAPIGTQQSGYAGPESGPFECENCKHFQPENEQFPKNCDHPTVVADPEVEQVDPEGCCTYFSTAGNESQAEEHGEEFGESGATPAAGEEGGQ